MKQSSLYVRLTRSRWLKVLCAALYKDIQYPGNLMPLYYYVDVLNVSPFIPNRVHTIRIYQLRLPIPNFKNFIHSKAHQDLFTFQILEFVISV